MQASLRASTCSAVVAAGRRTSLASPWASCTTGSSRRTLRMLAMKPNASFDKDDDLVNDLADELTAVIDPKRMERMQKHLELLWKVTKSKGVESCTCCRGSGEKECDWCHGTGVMTIGDTIYVNINKSQCPVCKAKGYVKCEFCRGTGSRAKWLGPPPSGQQKQTQ